MEPGLGAVVVAVDGSERYKDLIRTAHHYSSRAPVVLVHVVDQVSESVCIVMCSHHDSQKLLSWTPCTMRCNGLLFVFPPPRLMSAWQG